MRQLCRYREAVDVLQQLRRDAPEWLVQQRYARDILGQIIGKRRTLTAETRELADFIKVPYGCYSRLWWAYPLFAVHRRVILYAGNPETLIARMDAADRDLRIRPEHGEGQQP